MAFINIILLGGIATFTIPLIIHLLHKRRYQEVHWGATHLLEDVIRKNHRRMALEQILLLIVRILIPIVLALCLARPVLTALKRFLGNQKTSAVVLLDNSYSMGAGGISGSLLSRAKSEIGGVIDGLPKGSDANIILMGGKPRGVLDDPTTALDTIPERVRERASASNPIRVEEALRAGIVELGRMGHAAREVVVISDFRKADWGDKGSGARVAAAAEMAAQNLVPQVTLFRLETDTQENISVESVDVSAIILGAGQKFRLRANVKNYGKASYPDLEVWFDADGSRVRSSRINLSPNGEGQVLFTHQFDKPGDHVVAVGTSGDGLEEDNVCYAVLPVWDSVKTILVNGHPSKRPLEGETDFLEIALQPFASAKASLNDLIVSEVVETGKLNPDMFKDAKVVVLANVDQLDNWKHDRLKKWVAGGGALLVFCGDRLRLDWYHRDFFKNGEGLLPCRLAGFGNEGAGRKGRARVARILGERFSHPALSFFNDARNGRLPDAEFTNWYRLALPTKNAALPTPNVMARFDNGDIFLVERPFGRGRVIQCAAPADTDWSNMPVQTFYLPLMQRLVTHLASSVAPPQNITVGEPLRALAPPEAPKETGMIVADPSGEEHRLEIREDNGRRVVEFLDTHLAGIYKLKPGDAATASEIEAKFFAANFDRAEADLEPLPAKALEAVAAELGAKVVTSGEEYANLDRVRRFGLEIWKPLLVTVLVLLFGELILQQWISRRTL